MGVRVTDTGAPAAGWRARLARDRDVVIGLVAIAILCRLALLPLVDPIRDLRGGDANYYLLVAETLLAHGVHAVNEAGAQAAYRGPGYSFFVAGLIGAGGGPPAIFAAQALSTIGAGLLAFFALQRHDRALAMLAALLIVISPFHILLEFRVLAEIFYGALLLAGWLLLFRGGSLWRSAAAGTLIGLAILAREIFVLLPLALLPAAMLQRSRPKVMAHALTAVIVAYLVVLPWPLRNQGLPDGVFQVSEGRMGWNLWVGTWEQNADWQLVHPPALPPYAFRSAREEAELRAAMQAGDDRPFKRVALERLRTEPLAVLRTWLGRYHRLWLGTRSDLNSLRVEPGSAAWTAIKSAFWALNALLLAAGIAGLLLALRQRSALLIFAVPILYTALIYLPFHNAETRYSLAALPFLYIFGSFFAVQSFRHLSWRDRVPAPV